MTESEATLLNTQDPARGPDFTDPLWSLIKLEFRCTVYAGADGTAIFARIRELLAPLTPKHMWEPVPDILGTLTEVSSPCITPMLPHERKEK